MLHDNANPRASFATGRCTHCAKQVLTYERLDDNDQLVRVCLTCHSALEPTDWVTLEELDGVGYEVIPEKKSCGTGGGCGCSTKRAPTPAPGDIH